MQDRYAGDIGDFGKFGLLKAIERQGLSIGINWYLTNPEGREKLQRDGGYTISDKYFSCDQELAASLFKISKLEEGRSVDALEKASLLKTELYYHEPVSVGEERIDWHQEALQTLAKANVIFLDPDNGLLANSVRKTYKRAVKYILDEELEDYLDLYHAL